MISGASSEACGLVRALSTLAAVPRCGEGRSGSIERVAQLKHLARSLSRFSFPMGFNCYGPP